MSPLPAKMVNRWQGRHEPRPDEGAIHWHVLVGDPPEARDLAQTAQA